MTDTSNWVPLTFRAVRLATGLGEKAAMQKALAALTREVREDGIVGRDLVWSPSALVVLGRRPQIPRVL